MGQRAAKNGRSIVRIQSRAMGSLLVLGVMLSLSGCKWKAWEPAEKRPPVPQEPVLPLPINQPQEQELNCPAGNCMTRFRVQVERPGTLTIVATPGGDESHTSMNLTLEDSIGRVLDQQAMTRNQNSVKVSGSVQAGPHMILVQAMGGFVPYSIRALFRAGGAATQPWADPEAPPPLPARRPQERETPADKMPAAIYDPTVNFHTLRNYAFAEEPKKQLQAPPGSHKTDPLSNHEVQRALRGELTRRGFTQVPVADADFLISTHIGSEATTWYSLRGFDHRDSYDAYDQSWHRTGNVRPHTYSDHTLSLDFIDPRTGKLIWHGWTTEPESTDGEKTTAIRNAVTRLLDQYPPR